MSKEELLNVVYSWKTMIEKNGEKWPTATLNDLKSSIQFVLDKEGKVNDLD